MSVLGNNSVAPDAATRSPASRADGVSFNFQNVILVATRARSKVSFFATPLQHLKALRRVNGRRSRHRWAHSEKKIDNPPGHPPV